MNPQNNNRFLNVFLKYYPPILVVAGSLAATLLLIKFLFLTFTH